MTPSLHSKCVVATYKRQIITNLIEMEQLVRLHYSLIKTRFSSVCVAGKPTATAGRQESTPGLTRASRLMGKSS